MNIRTDENGPMVGWSVHARASNGLHCSLTLDSRVDEDTALGLDVHLEHSSPSASIRAAACALLRPPSGGEL